MSLSKSFQPFVKGAPCAVIARLAVEYLVDDETLKALFSENATLQYEREVTLTNLVNVMLDVACGTRRSPRAAFLRDPRRSRSRCRPFIESSIVRNWGFRKRWSNIAPRRLGNSFGP